VRGGAHEFADSGARGKCKLRKVADHTDRHTLTLQLREFGAGEDRAQLHEQTHLGRIALPVFGGKAEDRQNVHAGRDGAAHGSAQRTYPAPVAFRGRNPAILSPAPVPVHDDRDVHALLCTTK